MKMNRTVLTWGLNPQTLPPESWPRQEAYVKAVVQALKDEPGLLMWDLMNEPSYNDWQKGI
jgi:hypothetical protein